MHFNPGSYEHFDGAFRPPRLQMDLVWRLLEKIQSLCGCKGTSELALSCKSFDHGLLAFVAELRGVKEISVVEAVEIKANSILIQSRLAERNGKR